MFVFGSGVLIGTPQGGSPINFGLAQEISLNIATTTKALYGQNNFPGGDRLGHAQDDRQGQARAHFRPGARQSVLRRPPERGGTQTQFGEATSVPASSPYTYSTTFHTTFVADQGVVYAASGLPLKQVASGPATGQYSVAGGVYTFAAGDAGAAVLISYTYTVAASGESIAVASQLDRPVDHVLGQSVRFRSDDRQAVLDAALQLRRRKTRLRHQARGFHGARARLPVFRQRGRPGLPAQLRRRRVSEETFPSSLAGRRWALPHLPFRAIKAIQPALFQVYRDAGGEDDHDAERRRARRSADRAARPGDLARDRSCRSGADLRRLPRSSVLGRRSPAGVSFCRQGGGPARQGDRGDAGGVARARENRFRRADRPSRRQCRLDLGRGARRPHRAALSRVASRMAGAAARSLAARRGAEISPADAAPRLRASPDARGNGGGASPAAGCEREYCELRSAMSDANVAVNFTASVGDLVSGVADARDALASLSAPFEQLNGQYAALGASIGQRVRPLAVKSYNSALSASAVARRPRLPPPMRKPPRRSARATPRPPPTPCAPPRKRSPKKSRRSRTALKQKLAVYADDAPRSDHRAAKSRPIPRRARRGICRATSRCCSAKAALGGQKLAQAQRVQATRYSTPNDGIKDQMSSSRASLLDEQQREYESFGNTITRGLRLAAARAALRARRTGMPPSKTYSKTS